MKMPGFSAEASIYRSSGQYRAHTRHTPSEAGTIEPAMFWGSLENENCVPGGLPTGERYKRAILWDIPFPMNWDEACRFLPHPQLGYADSCGMCGLNMCGRWKVPDPTCRRGTGPGCPPGCHRVGLECVCVEPEPL